MLRKTIVTELRFKLKVDRKIRNKLYVYLVKFSKIYSKSVNIG
jgi:hypothetical protein